MSRAWIAWLVAGMALTAGGCAMCCSPYDECGPLFSGRNPQLCNPNTRAGSVLSAPTTPVVAPQPMGGEILSTTDQKASEQVPTTALPAEETVAEPAAAPANPQSSVTRGWKPIQAGRAAQSLKR